MYKTMYTWTDNSPVYRGEISINQYEVSFTERADIAVIGSGPAGISAAITAKVREKNIILFGMGGLSEKISKAKLIRNYPALPEISGEQLAKAFADHLESLDIAVRKEQVSNIYPMGDYFSIVTASAIYEAEAVILATGATHEKPLPGEDRLLGRGVSYCATCDAFFFRGKTVIVLGYSDESKSEAEFLAETCAHVYYLPIKGDARFDAENITVISGKPLAILGDTKAEALQTDTQTYHADGIFILRDAVSPDKLVHGLHIDGSHVAVDMQMKTDIPGCFACGDVAGPPYQYIKAAGQGNTAALSAVAYLAKKKRQ